MKPSNDRDWLPNVARTPWATVDGDRVTIHNVRNFTYRTEFDFTPAWTEKTYDLRKLEGIDIVASYWMGPDIAHVFVSFSTAYTLPLWGLVSSFFINFFAPSGGGHWVLQGPFMIEAAKSLGASQAHTAMSVMLGNGWNDLVQPFWILPALALSKLKLKDIMGYTVVSMFVIGGIYIAAILIWPHL